MTDLYRQSLFQTSQEQRSRFNKLVEMAQLLRDSCLDGEQHSAGFTNLIGDVWIAFYALEPKLMSNAQQIDALQFEFLTNLMQLDEYRKWHHLTRGDELLSVLTSIAIAEQLKQTVKENTTARQTAAQKNITQCNEQLAVQQLQSFHQRKARQTNTQNQQSFDQQIQLTERRMRDLRREAATLEESLKLQLINKNRSELKDIMKKSMPIAKKAKETVAVVSTMDGKNLKQVPISDQFELAAQLNKQPTLKRIAELAGRFKKIATKKQKTKLRHTMERRNITLGQEVARLLPNEMANLLLPQTKVDFLRRYAAHQTFVFDTKGKNRRGRGPIIICMDESSSMTSIKEESKAFCMALLMIARKQKRDFAIIPFASQVGGVEIFKKGNASTQSLIRFCQSFLGGGTNFENPLQRALEILTDSKFNEADLLFVTDGSSFLSTSFIDHFNTIKKQKQFECTAIVLKNLFNAMDLKVVHGFSDKVIEVDELLQAEEAFLIY